LVKKLQLKPEELNKQLYLSKDNLGQTAWHMAAKAGHVEILEKLWVWAKELQINPEDIRNQLYFSKDGFGQTTWHITAKRAHVEVLEKLWDWAKELQLEPEELKKLVVVKRQFWRGSLV
jgi:ankyrin repeat protein